jgi:D-alanyl-D-alanine carboxypeptidase (penicillin-binding protein 5/6)
MARLLLIVVLLAGLARPGLALDTAARAAIVIDHGSGTVLLEKNAEQELPPASMSKLMTIYMVFEAIKEGRLSLDDRFRVSVKAWQMGGSRMFVQEGDMVSVEDLILGMIVHSGNDACVVVAEGLAGSEEAFAERMNAKAAELGLTHSHFTNSTGWPDPGQYMSVRDLARLAGRLIDDFPDLYPYFSRTEFSWADIEQENRNPLLGLDLGADGLKTGHTEEAGYGLVGSAVKDGRRVILVVTGLGSMQERLVESERLLSWAFRDFAALRYFGSGQTVAAADVWLGTAGTVDLVAARDLDVLVPVDAADTVAARVVYQGPIEAPIAQGAHVADLVVEVPGIGETRYPLLAGAAVERGGFVTRVRASASLLMTRALSAGQQLTQ